MLATDDTAGGDGRRAALREAVALYTGDLLEARYDEWVSGDRARALAVYHDCSSTLERELSVAPAVETRAAYQALVAREPEGRSTVAAPVAAPPPLVGRIAERVRLVAAWRNSVAGQAQFVLVSGEPGVGKTRLVEEYAAWGARRGAVVADARCYGGGGVAGLRTGGGLAALGARFETFTPTRPGRRLDRRDREYVDVPDTAAREGMVQAGLPEWLADQIVNLWGERRRGDDHRRGPGAHRP